MTRVCSIFSQILQLIPRLEFESAVRKPSAVKAVEGLFCIHIGVDANDQTYSIRGDHLLCVSREVGVSVPPLAGNGIGDRFAKVVGTR